jgi:hypothetical protein
MIQYYRKIEGGLTIDNPEVIPLLLHMRWFGQSTAENVHLKIHHPCGDNRHENIIWTLFHRILWDDVDDSRHAPFRKARLRLEGKQYNDYSGRKPLQVDIFAIVELDMARLGSPLNITFSPVRFGTNGKPDLSSHDQLLAIATDILSLYPKGTVWQEGALSSIIGEKNGWGPENPAVPHYISEFEKLRVISGDSQKHKLLMSAEEFEKIFGVKL